MDEFYELDNPKILFKELREILGCVEGESLIEKAHALRRRLSECESLLES